MINTQEQKTAEDFSSIKLRLASPDNIHEWSFGEVLRPETINYRTQKPEKDGLFCEKIFGPVKDWECYCGKYKKIRYKGIVCDKCGVEVTRAVVRRERMGHIDLAVAVSHIWFLRGVPSRIGLALDMSIQNLEKVIYFADFIITSVNESLKAETLVQLKVEYKQYRKQIESDFDNRLKQLRAKGLPASASGEIIEGQISKLTAQKEEKLSELENTLNTAETELKELKPLKIISEHAFHDLSLKYGHVFEAEIGAEAIRNLLAKIDITKTIAELDKDLEKSTGAKRDRLIRRIKFFNHLIKNNIRPEWMILNVVPVIPPDLRPMVPLDGGRFATSDLNDLYRRVINRNNRLKQLRELNAPEIITRNEKRMLQEAVDALIDNNARHGKTVVASTGQKRMLKSIADMLKGKQGRFRQNLLGKRIDYSGRSVIVVGPELKLDQCGIPKIMALELFKPFIISKLIKRGLVHNVRSANRYIEVGHDEIWDLLEEVVSGAYVLLNRAPTLHRLGIQAFKPILTEGKAIRIHPLVCSAFNADFDGDQMAVHVPLTEGARKEAAELMLSSKNLLKPSDGRPIVTPNQDIVLGCYYLTTIIEKEKPRAYSSINEAMLAYNNEIITLHDQIKVMMIKKGVKTKKKELQAATIGRILFNSVLPKEFDFVNERVTKKSLGKILGKILYQFGPETTVTTLDALKELGFKYLTISAQSIGMDDLGEIKEREGLIEEGNVKLDEIEQQYQMGLLTEDERHDKIVELWLRVNNSILGKVQGILKEGNSIRAMIDSGARGTWGQLNQMIGMKGPVVNPSYEVIELPVKSNFKKGFDVLEFFISTHGARKGLTDTALRTSSAGYLTRRLVDVAQDVIVSESDCHDMAGLELTKAESEAMGEALIDRLVGRYPAEDIINPKTKKVLVEAGELITEKTAEGLRKIDLPSVRIRSVLSCKTLKGICQKCYGYDLGYNKLVETGTAVGIIAAQSVGEPGTQLTMRTFHTGGVASEGDITQGLPRVEEIFETRSPKAKAIVADVKGQVKIVQGQREIRNTEGQVLVTSSRERVLQISYDNQIEKKIPLPKNKIDLKIEVKNGDQVGLGQVLFKNGEETETSPVDGTVEVGRSSLTVTGKELGVKEYLIPGSISLLVKDGETVEPGDQLTEGSLDLHEIFKLKGQEFTQKYIMREIQHIYSSQGQKLNDKHAEVIVRQMFSKVYIREAGDSDLLPGEIVEYIDVVYENQKIRKAKKKEIEFDRLLLGITKVSLSTRSWLAAASFQETAKVLINAAITGKTDDLSGLKENIIIGRLIPAGTGFKKKI
ncbi:MAG: DNA-directed RNA polymerase subunit beta' [Candidatus Buchananbacteria bacterium RIFCSPHIGHO2_02_FULL_40_13]|uniref:DNA-directed RNA polymerase subunit beta' n=1 Tax=Candidatus Buchananbacteria bacterium RIFCSPLOWO2_01_FULL_39_33 TaxID=1797543 RepID=A0A1G1YHY4_9BACT|nr:MAG: DNA-directed RNA polymerase subunit beta' [Candidatus Buchananbacteria bacterium RIFCSPHIGHO2_01_FULL_40_35]OGY49793.1 MAG: DNA-directed RNA polymerase subunit beta' [Candidatus Buchananbacteria bacterium RIFCSPHIGHO2_02_FULL_40_13]OGY51416.1 MAG: DNA-directed RNA polymerase subunit beta' [Candidatus Buchananbacteria bacterium RIFCSPLOWO2_01_FULL_39_33]